MPKYHRVPGANGTIRAVLVDTQRLDFSQASNLKERARRLRQQGLITRQEEKEMLDER